MKPVLAVDMDDVLFEYVAEFLNHYNKKTGNNFQVQNFTTWRFETILGCSKAQCQMHMKSYGRSADFLRTPAVEGSLQGIELLASDYDLVVVTARPESLYQETHDWLSQNYPGKISDVRFMRKKIQDSPIPKSQVCKEIGAFALIDDHPENAKECAQNGIPAYLFNRPWNQGELPLEVRRVHSWQEITDMLCYDASVTCSNIESKPRLNAGRSVI